MSLNQVTVKGQKIKQSKYFWLTYWCGVLGLLCIGAWLAEQVIGLFK